MRERAGAEASAFLGSAGERTEDGLGGIPLGTGQRGDGLGTERAAHRMSLKGTNRPYRLEGDVLNRDGLSLRSRALV